MNDYALDLLKPIETNFGMKILVHLDRPVYSVWVARTYYVRAGLA